MHPVPDGCRRCRLVNLSAVVLHSTTSSRHDSPVHNLGRLFPDSHVHIDWPMSSSLRYCSNREHEPARCTSRSFISLGPYSRDYLHAGTRQLPHDSSYWTGNCRSLDIRRDAQLLSTRKVRQERDPRSRGNFPLLRAKPRQHDFSPISRDHVRFRRFHDGWDHTCQFLWLE